MSGHDAEPPSTTVRRIARCILERALPAHEREFILGDLEELHQSWMEREGVRVADWGYVKALFASVASRFISPHRRRMERHLSGRRRAGADFLTEVGQARRTLGRNSMEVGMDGLLADVLYGIRRLRQSPGFALVVVLTLGLGIGANTAIFSVVNAVLLRPLPYEAPDELVSIQHVYPSLDIEGAVSPRGLRWYRDEARSFSGVAAEAGWAANLTGDGEPERVTGRQVSGDYFDVLGVRAAYGRTLLSEEAEPGRNRVVVLSDGFWRRRFGGDPSIVGRDIQLNGRAYQVAGVMPPEFHAFFNREAELWTPIALEPAQMESNAEWMDAIARLAPGVEPDAAAAELSSLAARIRAEYPDAYPPDWTLQIVSLDELASGDLRPALLLLLGAVGFVLLIACANVANLLLARAAGRVKEVAVRRALGATPMHLLRQFVTESLVLSLLGGVVGLVLAYWGVRSLAALAPAALGPDDMFAIDGTVLAFTLGLSLLTGIAFGFAPGLQAAGADVQSVIREGGSGMRAERTGQLLRRSLVVGELALALTLLVGAGLLIRSFDRLQSIDPGFRADNLLTFEVALTPARYGSDTAQIAFFEQSAAAVAALPGVQAVGLTEVLPFSGGWSTSSFGVEGFEVPEGQQGPWGDYRLVSAGYFDALGIPLLGGRAFDERDRLGSQRVAIIDEELARRYFAGRDPLSGRIIQGTNAEGEPVYADIIGVVRHTKQEALDAEDRVQLYYPYAQYGGRFLTFAVRTALDPVQLVPAVRQAIGRLDPDQPIARVSTMDALISDSVVQKRLSTTLFTLFAGIALLLAVLGIYGVMSYLVSQRSQEIGVRMALGARRTGVLALVLRQGMQLVLLGLVLGLLGAFALTRLLASQLYGVEPTDPVTFIAVSAILLASAVAGTMVPAMRATRLDPNRVLRPD